MGVAYGSSTIYQATKGIVQDGLTLNLDMGVSQSYSGTGTAWLDLSSTGNGTLNNSPEFSKTKGGVITFDGTDDNVTLGTGGSLGLDGYHSVEFWVYPFTNNTDRGLINCYDGGEMTNNYIHYNFRSSRIHMGWYSNDLSEPAGHVVPNTWHHVFYIFDDADDKRRIYKNATLLATDGTARTTTPAVTSATAYLGYYTGGSRFYGLMTSCRIYNRALTATEVAQNFNVTRHRFGI